jgi:hypothetical protein
MALATLIAMIVLPVRVNNYQQLLMSDDYAECEKVVVALRDAKLPMLIAHRGLDFFLHLPSAARRIPF